MNSEWSLDVIYKGYDDPKYKEDKINLGKIIKELESLCNMGDKPELEEQFLLRAVDSLENYTLISYMLSAYVSLRQSVNTSESETVNQSNEIERLVSEASKPLAMIKKLIAKVENLDTYFHQYPKLREYYFMMSEIKEEASYLLSDDVEEVIAKMNISAGSSWGTMQSYLTSTLDVDYKGEEVTLSQIRNLAHSEDPKVRKEAYEAEVVALEKIKDPVAFSLNNIKTQVNMICELRGYKSSLDQTLHLSRMKHETLDALLEAIKEYLPVFHKYLKHKGTLLGHSKGLPWYDMFAPMGETNQTFTTEEAKEYLLKHFNSFSEDLADMVQEAFDEEWIDFYPKKGKVGGAFCENLPAIKQSRILSNFTGTFNDVVTLAHELGHAYHGLLIQDHRPLNTDYSMPVAETASTFNETIIIEAAKKEGDDSEKKALLEGQLQDVTQIICDIYSRYLFESAVFEKSKAGFLFPDELSEIMLQSQKEAYGDGLDHSTLHPYMWVVKGHYYSENLSFYNFPYAFGGLFARGLYEKYKEEGEEFIPKYRSMLHATTVMSVENCARMADVNIEDPSFWKTSLHAFEKLVDEYISLTSK